MSGLEGLAALGLACSIFQTVSFGRETLALVKEVYRNGTIDQSLMDKSTAIQEVASDIIAVEIPRPLGRHEQKLFDVTKKCTGFARDLNEEIAFLMGHNAKGNLRVTLMTAVKVNWRRRRLERMEKDLADSEQIMQSALLAWIFKSSNSANVNIDSLGGTLRHFVLQYERGCRQASELVSKQSLQVQQTIVRESGKTEMAIRNHVTQTAAKFEQKFEDHFTQTVRERLREGLLNSLKYPGMNERANQIDDAHAHTFRWLFADQDSLSHSDDEQDTNESQYLDEWDVSSQETDYSIFINSPGYENDYGNRRPEMVWSSFTDWLQSNLTIYWIMGKPGSGKSTLTKFILSEPDTEALLEKWRRDVIIASHHFWRPGTLMQRNIKGMLCSIAYQLVFAIPDALNYELLDVDRLRQKHDSTDWSAPELQRLCSGLIGYSGKPLCLLIDGLDECGPEDEHKDLLAILETLRSANVKIVVSSRNEPVFERAFRHEPQLRMQDMTAGDLNTYATNKLCQVRGKFFFCNYLVEKAEGVFLWLVLAVQSLNRGFANGDSATDLLKRMETLPKRLNNLYKDMWERLNDDADIYRKDAALFFRLVIAPRAECMKDGMSIMNMMLASSEASQDAFAQAHMVSTSQLLEQCERFQRNVEIRCAGLLAVGQRVSIDLDYAQDGLRDPERALLYYAHKASGFQFIHRSVRDFLVDSLDGKDILQYEGMSADHLDMCVLGAGLRAAELLHPILEKVGYYGSCDTTMYAEDEVELYLEDLSRLAEGSEDFVESLFSRCLELYSSSILWLPRPGDHRYNGMRPARHATFFRFAACLPNLDRHSIKLIEKRLEPDIWSAILLAFVANGSGMSGMVIYQQDLLSLARWLSHLPYEIDINLKAPLVALRPQATIGSSWATCTLDGIGPLDHIKESPFTRLLGFGLENLDWRPTKMIQNQPEMTRFLQLVCDFVSHGGDLRSTMLLACPDRWDDRYRGEGKPKEDAPHFLFEMLGWDFFERCSFKDDDRVLCVATIEAATAIQRMLANLLATDHDSSKEKEHSLGSDTSRPSDLEAAVSFLAQRCQEHGRGPEGRIVGLLQPCGNFADMPYRLVSAQDSVNLINDIWACMHASEYGVCREHLAAQLREVVARSPFSCIGFRDYLRDHGDFDEFAAHALLMDCRDDVTQWW